jgi:hypothetical protein
MSHSMTQTMHELSVAEVTEVAGGGLKSPQNSKLSPTLVVTSQVSSTTVFKAASVAPPRT